MHLSCVFHAFVLPLCALSVTSVAASVQGVVTLASTLQYDINIDPDTMSAVERGNGSGADLSICPSGIYDRTTFCGEDLVSVHVSLSRG